jgi:hypothetical protein
LDWIISSVEIFTTTGETFCTALTTGVRRGLSGWPLRGEQVKRIKTRAIRYRYGFFTAYASLRFRVVTIFRKYLPALLSG